MNGEASLAPGAPGIEPRWTSSAKSGVGTALSSASRLWFTLSHGIVNEVYFPRIDEACIRDLGIIVTADGGFFSEEKRHARHAIAREAPGIPAYRLTNTCRQGRYRIEKWIFCDPDRDVLLQRIRFEALVGSTRDYRVHVLLAPHLGNRGWGNTARVSTHKGVPVLSAEGHGRALVLASSRGWRRRSVGYVGFSDAWQDLAHHGRMEWSYGLASDGNVALAGELDLGDGIAECVLALGFGLATAAAGHHALASLAEDFEDVYDRYVSSWKDWQRGLQIPAKCEHTCCTAASVLRVHEAKGFPGGLIASLSIPWGDKKGDEDLGGYHLVWPRDLVESAAGLLAAGACEEVRRVIAYLRATQEADGHWPQNMWLDGTPYWIGVQLDETALPILLVDLCWRRGALDPAALRSSWPMVRAAACFLARCGPVTDQDRWEEDSGYSPFTLSTEIAALLAASELAEHFDDDTAARYLRETADVWNACIEAWTYVEDTPLARRFEVGGYYVRIAPPDTAECASPLSGFVPIKNRPPGSSSEPAEQIVSPDALALVRFGLRRADDPRILNTVRVIDGMLRVETSRGPCFRRYNGDGYGEHDDGSAFDGTGTGRLWPLLTAERAHYELAAGRTDEAIRLLHVVEAFASRDGLLPEQIWDGPDLPRRGLRNARPTGSAMPLVWAHAEMLKLARSIHEGAVFDLPPQTVKRYRDVATSCTRRIWRLCHKLRAVPAGSALRVECPEPAVVHWSTDAWQSVRDQSTRDSTCGVHYADLQTQDLAPGSRVVFTFRWRSGERWEGTDYAIDVIATPQSEAGGFAS
jgi:glucoamylase